MKNKRRQARHIVINLTNIITETNNEEGEAD